MQHLQFSIEHYGGEFCSIEASNKGVASLALRQSYDCPSASEVTLKDMGNNAHESTKNDDMISTKLNTKHESLWYAEYHSIWLCGKFYMIWLYWSLECDLSNTFD